MADKRIRITRLQPGVYRIDGYEDGVKVSSEVARATARELSRDLARARREMPDVKVTWTRTARSGRARPRRRKA